MSTPHAILISLLEQPSSGYDLARRFDRSMGYFWRATHQQIYRELGRMQQQGWIAVVNEGASDPVVPRKKVYQVLPAGRAEVERWVRDVPTDVEGRNVFLIKLRAEAVIGPLGLTEELKRLIELHRERLQTYLDIERRDFGSGTLSQAQQVQYAILKAGILSERAWLGWASEVAPLLMPSSY
jgi:DNA-binding PadR family transcriptional regulator